MADQASVDPNESPIPHVGTSGTRTAYCPGCGQTQASQVLLIPGDPSQSRRHFAYTFCAACETLAFADDEVDPGQFYGEGYYSQRLARQGALKRTALRVRNHINAAGPSWLNDLVRARSEHAVLPSLRPILLAGRIGRASRWLDIGCGAGRLLHDMRDIGFRDLTGADPFMQEEVQLPGLRLMRTDGLDLNESFDCVMMHHSLEHMPDTDSVLKRLHTLVRPEGVALIRLPLCGSYAWRRYGGEWGNLDAPRHLVLWSARGFIAAAERAGWNVGQVVYDSKGRSLYASEARLVGASEHFEDVRKLFSRADIASHEAQAVALNESGAADSAAFYLTR